MVVALVVFCDFRAYMLLWVYGMVGIIAWVWIVFVAEKNSGKVWYTRPSEPVSPRRDLHEQARAALELLLRRKLLFWARHHLAQARDARLSEHAWKPWHVASVLAQARNLTFGRGVVSLKREGLA